MKQFKPKTFKDLLDILGKNVQLGKIDMEGFCGRELHPDKSDGGTIVQIVGLDDVEDYFGNKMIRPNKIAYYISSQHKNLPEETTDPGTSMSNGWLAFFIGRKVDGTFIEITDSEIESIF